MNQRKRKVALATACASAGTMLVGGLGGAAEQIAPDRTVLPIQEPPRPVITELDVRNAKQPPEFSVKAPAGAPNVIIILVDDLGFGATGTYGGPIPTPTLQGLAENGLRYTNFHTTALCRRRAPRSSPGAITTWSTWASSRRWRRGSPAPPARSRMRRPRWPRCCA